jgi:hypothetical protein
LCFKCGDKYTPTHTCATTVSTLNMLAGSAVDGGDILSDEVLQTLEYTLLSRLDQDCYLSLHAVSGQPQQKAIQIRALFSKSSFGDIA